MDAPSDVMIEVLEDLDQEEAAWIAELRATFGVTKYDAQQPRVPKGTSNGGQWTTGAAFQDYTTHGLEINGALRADTREVSILNRAQAIDQLFARYGETVGPGGMTVWRGITHTPPKGGWRDAGFTSTSLSRNQALEFSDGVVSDLRQATMLRVQLPPGTRILRVPKNAYDTDQEEILLPRRTLFVVQRPRSAFSREMVVEARVDSGSITKYVEDFGPSVTKYDADQPRAPKGQSNGGQWTKAGAEERYPRTNEGATLDGLTVGSRVDNTESIAAELTRYRILPGIRVVDFKGTYAWDERAWLRGTARDDVQRTQALVNRIRQSGRIDPLIVVHDRKGPYVLEGSHRIDAMHLMGKTRVPAVVVLDLDDLEDAVAKYDAQQPRAPKGVPNGGQWVSRDQTQWSASVPADAGYVYHTTERYNLDDIAEQGLRRARPSHRGEQEYWPSAAGGSGREGRVYFGASPKAVDPFRLPDSALIRAPRTALKDPRNESGDLFVRHNVKASVLEVYSGGTWHPMTIRTRE